jgi:hypothetical protein
MQFAKGYSISTPIKIYSVRWVKIKIPPRDQAITSFSHFRKLTPLIVKPYNTLPVKTRTYMSPAY